MPVVDAHVGAAGARDEVDDEERAALRDGGRDFGDGVQQAARRLAVDGGDDVGTELRELRAQRLRAHERAVGRFEVFGARAYRLGHFAEAVAEYAVRDGEDFIAGLYDALHRAPEREHSFARADYHVIFRVEHLFEKILVLREKLEKFLFEVGAAVVGHVGFAVLGGHGGRPWDEREFVGFHRFHSFGVPRAAGRGYRKSAGVLLSPALR